jgi:hypothetical protein
MVNALGVGLGMQGSTLSQPVSPIERKVTPMKRIGLFIFLFTNLCLYGYAQQSIKTEDVFNRCQAFTGTASQDTIRDPSSYKANLDSAKVRHLVAININAPVASDSIFVWQATNPTGARYFGKWIIPSTAPAPFSIRIDTRVDSSYVIIKRYKTSDVTLIFRYGY